MKTKEVAAITIRAFEEGYRTARKRSAKRIEKFAEITMKSDRQVLLAAVQTVLTREFGEATNALLMKSIVEQIDVERNATVDGVVDSLEGALKALGLDGEFNVREAVYPPNDPRAAEGFTLPDEDGEDAKPVVADEEYASSSVN